MKISSQCGGSTMEDSSPSQNHNGQLGPSGGAVNVGNKQNEEGSQITQYSIPGILHFIQHEWARFEMERSQWEVDRAELQARIAFLQGERKGQENLKNDLVRRIKMLEYALKQERAKYHKLKYGTELQQGDVKPPIFDEPGGPEAPVDGEAPFTTVSNVSWRQGRQLLRQYLQEIGYTDTIIDVRSNRVRALLGINNNAENEENQNNAAVVTNVNGNESSNKRASESQGRRTPAKKVAVTFSSQSAPPSLTEAMILDTEAAVMSSFEFLAQEEVDMDDDDDMSDDLDEAPDDEQDDVKTAKRKGKSLMLNESLTDDVDAEAEEVLNELNMLTEVEDSGGDIHSQNDPGGRGLGFQVGSGHRRQLGPGLGDDEVLDSTLGLGDLAQLTVNNEAEAAYDIAATKESYRKTWTAKYTLRSHFDGVRALAFHPVEPVLITASEDHTLKLWNLLKTAPAKKSASLDVEPLYTFRGHTGPVLCLAMTATGEQCYSGGLDGNIHCWNLPCTNIDPYDSFDPGVLTGSMEGHTDAVWGLSIQSQQLQLLSCSADGTVKLWSPTSKMPLLSTYTSEQDGAPTSVDFIRDEQNRMVAAYNSAHCVIFDIETGKQLLRLETSPEVDNNVMGRQINCVVAHPLLPLTITAHEDRHIRFFDNTTGKLVHSMVAHLDSVTSLAVDPNGLYLLSGSHDCSIRLWNLENKTCVQEITAHRKKFDESIFDVAFHPSRPYIASAGADALAKVFV
ncbi:striatin-3 isoform X2 [Schistocerca piceifrons]|uniref:striatin-3 isoform X2 n=1 Tax=Schistocerca piceifrons TaxID=274613 RepID=UPI001F5E59EB|nr:striatin-3 isoform X2 [Schistocerca piceifrons]XP_049788791.1 striatin-3 isoform X2 [Schistocerca nitens]XP_049939748.1 striatin-3 isoform X2 [Schistocerca serialis cubense]